MLRISSLPNHFWFLLEHRCGSPNFKSFKSLLYTFRSELLLPQDFITKTLEIKQRKPELLEYNNGVTVYDSALSIFNFLFLSVFLMFLFFPKFSVVVLKRFNPRFSLFIYIKQKASFFNLQIKKRCYNKSFRNTYILSKLDRIFCRCKKKN